METILDKLRKIDELARSGIGGERENARRMLAALCAKHKISPESLTSPERSDIAFSVRSDVDKKLLFQVVAYIRQTSTLSYSVSKQKPRTLWFALTPSEAVDVRECFTHYRREWAKQQADFLSAFIQKNGIVAPGKEDGEITAEDLARMERLMNLMKTMDSTPWEKRLRLERRAA